MDHKWQADFACRGDMSAKAALLCFARRIVVVIVEPRFAECDDVCGTAVRGEIGRCHIQLFMRVMWMRADRAKHLWKAFRDRKQFDLLPNTRRNRNNAFDTSRASARDNRVELGRKNRKIEMAVAIYKRQFLS